MLGVAPTVNYRKGELSPAAVDRGWPYQVAIPADRCAGKFFLEHAAFCAGLSLCYRGHSVHDGVTSYRVFCFADHDHATAFREAFGGVPFYPEDRGRGVNWMRWDRPPGDVRRPKGSRRRAATKTG